MCRGKWGSEDRKQLTKPSDSRSQEHGAAVWCAIALRSISKKHTELSLHCIHHTAAAKHQRSDSHSKLGKVGRLPPSLTQLYHIQVFQLLFFLKIISTAIFFRKERDRQREGGRESEAISWISINMTMWNMWHTLEPAQLPNCSLIFHYISGCHVQIKLHMDRYWSWMI